MPNTTRTAVPRTDYSGLPLEAQYTQQLRADPNFVVPVGYHAIYPTGQDGPPVVIKDPTFIQRNFAGSPRGTLGIMAAIGSLGFLPGGAFNPAAGAGAAGGGGAALTGSGEAGTVGGFGVPGAVEAAGAGSGEGGGTGILSTIGRLAKGKVGDILGGIGKGIGQASNAAAQNRSTMAELNAVRDANRISSESTYQRELADQARIDMDRRAADAKAREDGYKQSLRSQYLQNWTPAQRPDGIQTIHGGFNTISDASRATAAEMERQAAVRLLNGEKFAPMEAPRRVAVSEIPQSGLLEKIGNFAGPAASIWDYATRDQQATSLAQKIADEIRRNSGGQ